MSDPTRAYPPDPDSSTRTGVPGAPLFTGEWSAPAGYELSDEIGRGGMGIVYRARDLELGRNVAVKILIPSYSPDSPTARRFIDEAGITARLQHPGIPPIYRVGTLADGRPFLAMKLIDGQTLEEKLSEPVSPVGTESDPTAPRLDAVLRRGRFLTVFEQVAQAVGYAHQMGVIHRDLKPSNIMVGAFGEVQVMDWGIARSADRKHDPGAGTDGEPIATVAYLPDSSPAATPASDLTQAGSVLGTPAFMPPEQAIGAVDKIGKPSDVFGLGAILCVILTGKPPYAGMDAESNRQLAARAKLDDAYARLEQCGAEPELIALAKRCLAAEPSDRPSDAGEVAAAVAALRAQAEQRARQAEMDRARAEVKSAEERKRRRVQRALAITAFGLVAVAGTAAWWVDSLSRQQAADRIAQQVKEEADQKVREAERAARQLATERDVAAALNEVQLLREEGWKQSDDPARWALTLHTAHSSHKRAEALLESGEATDELRRRVATTRSHLDEDGRDRILLAELDRIADDNEIQYLIPIPFTKVLARRYHAAFKKHGIDLMLVPPAEAVAWLRAHRFRGRLLIGIRDWKEALPLWDPANMINVDLATAVGTSSAVAGTTVVEALAKDPHGRFNALLMTQGPVNRLQIILQDATEDAFIKSWWTAVQKRDVAGLKSLMAGPEFRRLSSREMASLADGLSEGAIGLADPGPLNRLLEIGVERFPGEAWVHYRLATQSDRETVPGEPKKDDTLLHLTAAVAARPNSAIARLLLGMQLMENPDTLPITVLGLQLPDRRALRPEGVRMIRSAMELDPASPWPHFFLGMIHHHEGNWPEASRELLKAVKLDPDTGTFLAYSISFMFTTGPNPISARELTEFADAIIAALPNHPGGYHLRSMILRKEGDLHGALAMLRKIRTLNAPDYFGMTLINVELPILESVGRWEEKLPAILRGELKVTSAQELTELATFCATFDRKYALASRFAGEALAANPALKKQPTQILAFALWSLRAGLGEGADAANIPPPERLRLRGQALTWLRAAGTSGTLPSKLLSMIRYSEDFRALQAELQKLPAGERAEWDKLLAVTDLKPIIPPNQK